MYELLESATFSDNTLNFQKYSKCVCMTEKKISYEESEFEPI